MDYGMGLSQDQIRAHLKGMRPRLDLDSQVVIGTSGGIAYLLFPNYMRGMPLPKVKAKGLHDASPIIFLFQYAERFITHAQEHAAKYEFNPVDVNPENIIHTIEETAPFENDLTKIYQRGIGTSRVNSLDELVDFGRVIESVEGDFELGKERTQFLALLQAIPKEYNIPKHPNTPKPNTPR